MADSTRRWHAVRCGAAPRQRRPYHPIVRIHAEVSAALQEGRPVVALESTIIAHGLPRPRNIEVARDIEAVVREEGAVPATVAIVGGEAVIGLTSDDLALIALHEGVAKVSVRDLPLAIAANAHGATTVASTAYLAARAGIRIFATGGLGGVHRGARESWDESADLQTLAQTRIAVVCAGVKSILDVAATLERLETLNVPVIGFGTDWFPRFYLADSPHRLDWRIDTPAGVAAVLRVQDDLGLRNGLVVANPVRREAQLDERVHDRTLNEGLRAAKSAGITGKAVTPFLLDYFHRETEGASLRVNIALVLANARLAARIAAAYAGG
ncbi:MAG: pseudouridine-5'-phosphate glycosidase [Chloroflexi bacterium]|nr:pseudouridine-5'-phosphate glycosidase [Chloroflexota bacterium]